VALSADGGLLATGFPSRLLCDGGVRLVRDAISLQAYTALASRSGGEVVSEF
jgi:hypothetical protein